MASSQYNPYTTAQFSAFSYPQLGHPQQHPQPHAQLHHQQQAQQQQQQQQQQQHPHSHPHPHTHPHNHTHAHTHAQISLDEALQHHQQHDGTPAPIAIGEPPQSLIQPDHQLATPTHPSHHHPIGSDPDHDNSNISNGHDNDNSILQTPEQAQIQTPGTAPGTATGSGKPRGRPKGSKTRPRPRSPSPATLARNPPPPPAPLYRGPYATIDDAIFALQLHCFTSGYGVSQMRGVREKLSNGKYDPEGPVIRKDFACDRGGREFQSKGTGQRKRESAKTGCGWRVAVRRLKREGDLWFMEVLQARHNHDATPQHRMDAIPSYRRWQRENNRGIRSAVNRLARAAQMPARTVAAYLRGEHPDPELDRVDRQILRALSMGDQEDLPDPADQSTTVFGIVARRPCIILRDGGNAGKEEQQQQQQLQLQQQQQQMQQQMQMQMQMQQGRQILPLPATTPATANET